MNWRNWNEFIIFMLAFAFNQKRIKGSSDPIHNKVVADVNDATSNRDFDIEAIQQWTDVGVGLSKITVATDSEAIIQAIQGLSSAIPYLGPILSGFLAMTPGSDKFDEVKQQLNEMDSHLFAIENKIDALAKLVTYTSILSYYMAEAEKINLLEMSYKRYMNRNTNINMNELIENCNRNNVLDYVYYVHRELSDSSILSLMTVMKDDYNLANFQLWMKMLIGSLSQCMMLHTVCMFAKYKDQPDLNDTMDGDIAFFQSMSDIMFNVVNDGTNDIKENFFEWAKVEIEDFASLNGKADHAKFVRDAWNMLVKKYFWRHWFVASYDDELYGVDNHYVTSASRFVFAWFRKHNRNVNVVHTNNNESNIDYELKAILDSRRWIINGDARCKYVYEYVDSRIGGCNSLGVISSESDFSAKWSKGTAAVHYVQSDGRGLNVFAVAPEK